MNSVVFAIWVLVMYSIVSCTKNQGSLTFASNGISGKLMLDNVRTCYFDDISSLSQKLEISIAKPTSREIDEVTEILGYIGLPQNFVVLIGDVSNAMAFSLEGRRFIVCNKDLLTRIDDIEGSNGRWSSLFVLAHEIGHHLANNISDTTNSKRAELEADAFAASVLYKMGADSNQVAYVFNSSLISNEQDTETHPSRRKRVSEIKNSWLAAARLRYQSAIPPSPIDEDSTLWGEFENELQEGLLSAFPPADSLRESGSVSDNVLGVVLDVAPWQLGEDSTGIETTFKVLILRPGTTSELDLEWSRNKIVELDVNFVSAGSAEFLFKQFLRPGRRMKFSMMKVRPTMQYLIRARNVEIM